MVSIVRWNPKEAVGKALLDAQESCEASVLDERANKLKVRCLYGKHGSRHGGHEREGVCAIPG